MSIEAASSWEPSPSGIGIPLPGTFLIGAAKSGTTALAEALRAHPEICMASRKEPHHYLFESPPDFTGRGDDQGLARWAVPDAATFASLFDHYDGEPVVAEASVFYLYRPDAIERIERERPGARYIVMLREPAARARSAHRHLVRDGREPESFSRALDLEPERIDAGWEYGWHYVAVSRYAEQLDRLFELVDRERVHVEFYERFEQDPVRVQERIADFLGVSRRGVLERVPRVNISGVPRSRTLHRLLDQPRAYLPDRVVDQLGRMFRLRELRARLLERNLEGRGAEPPRAAPDGAADLAAARRRLGRERDAVAAIVGETPPWD